MMVIANGINHRADGVKYPINPPPGWIFMALAIDDFGARALEEGGNYRDFLWASAPDIDSTNPARKWDVEHQKLARRRIPKLVRVFNAVLASGEVRSGYSTIGGGAVTPMDADWWRTDYPGLRYRTFSIDPAEPFSERVSLPCWIWIDAGTLFAAADRLYRLRMGWGPLPTPPTRPRVETYLREDGLLETYSYDESGACSVTIGPVQSAQNKAGRPSKTTRIQKLFADHLRSGEVASRVAWEGEAIRQEYGGDDPPKAETCADRVRAFYNMIQRDEAGNIVNAGVILDRMDYPKNPDKLLLIASK